MRRLAPFVAVLTFALALPIQAQAAAPQLTHTVSSGDLGPAREVVVEVQGTERVTFDFETTASSWGGRRLVFHAREGAASFDSRYFVRRGDRWVPITDEITSDAGWTAGRVETSRHVTIRLVVFAEPPPRWGITYERRYPVRAGMPLGTERVATATVETRR
jgi:hypothetical protein